MCSTILIGILAIFIMFNPEILGKGLNDSESDTLLVPLHVVVPHILTDVKYATSDNFTKQVLYATDTLFGREFALNRLKSAQNEANSLGFQLKVFDAFRPLSVQHIMWAILPDERYVADPAKGSRHNRGCAFDLTLCYLDGSELDMGTDYDEFTESAAYTYKNLPADILKNRELLHTIMSNNGFTVLPTEWWHYDAVGWEEYSILDL